MTKDNSVNPLVKSSIAYFKHSADVGHTQFLTIKINTEDPSSCSEYYLLALKHYERFREEIKAFKELGII